MGTNTHLRLVFRVGIAVNFVFWLFVISPWGAAFAPTSPRVATAIVSLAAAGLLNVGCNAAHLLRRARTDPAAGNDAVRNRGAQQPVDHHDERQADQGERRAGTRRQSPG
jgi:hypothetical protein